MNDEQLIELVRAQPVLYDLSHSKYMDNNCKTNIWNKIGKELNTSGTKCKTRWNNIRDNFRKSLKKKKARSSDNQKLIKVYKYSEQLDFLINYISERDPRVNIDDDNDEDNEEYETHVVKEEATTPAVTEEQFASDTSEDSQHQLTPSCPSTSKRRKLAVPQEAEYSLQNQGSSASHHAVDAFLAGVAPTLKSLTPYYLHLAKSEIFAIVQKYELVMLRDTHQYND